MEWLKLSQCPSCKSQRIWQNGIRQTKKGEIQRLICRNCGKQFSETTWNRPEPSECAQRIHRIGFYSYPAIISGRQVCVSKAEGMINLATVETRTQETAAGATQPSQEEMKAKILEHAFWLFKQGYREATINGRTQTLTVLMKRGVNILDPESVKEGLAKQPWATSRKVTFVSAYTLFLTMLNKSWIPPRYVAPKRLPFIPMETEIDQLISGCHRRLAAFLQLLKETGMRPGEGWKLCWTDIDTDRKVVFINDPEKGSRSRILPLSEKAISMIGQLAKKSEKIFGTVDLKHFMTTFYAARKRIAEKLGNPRIRNITFKTMRHFKGTTEYHKTRDILHVMKTLGHKNINNTLIYIDLENALFQTAPNDQFTVRAVKTLEEVCELLEAGFEYVTEMDENKILRKRK